jgi:transcriptional regulator with XRE-family HTH domain
MTIGLQIFKARDAAGLTQKQLADMLGIKKQSISDIECERRAISLKMIRRVATALDTEFVIKP